jgi:hypothetical protein
VRVAEDKVAGLDAPNILALKICGVQSQMVLVQGRDRIQFLMRLALSNHKLHNELLLPLLFSGRRGRARGPIAFLCWSFNSTVWCVAALEQC